MFARVGVNDDHEVLAAMVGLDYSMATQYTRKT
jgi:hypothetical protein